MKRFLILIFCLFFLGCSQVTEKKTIVSIVSNPDGGHKTSVYASVLVKPAKPVLVFVNWMWHLEGFPDSVACLKSEMIFVDSEQTFDTWYSTNSNNIFLRGVFWVRVSWEDGQAYQIESKKAVCY